MSLKSFLLDSSFSPVVVREYRSRLRKMRWFAMVYISVMMLLYATCLAMRCWQVVILLLLPTSYLCILMIVSLTANAITQEREQHTLELLLITPLSGRDIIVGKYLAACGYSLTLLLPQLLAICVLCVIGPIHLSPMKIFSADQNPIVMAQATHPSITVSGIFLLFSGALGIYFSTLCKRSSAATALTLTTLILGSMLITSLTIWMIPFNSSISAHFMHDSNRMHLYALVFNLLFVILEISGMIVCLKKAIRNIEHLRQPAI